ncbi:hypothetical protein N7481_009299 [Penicillium waksmanii]|uniref:uncharacterized protein n=1 Tax=Penicillium waksmanii TaxID=69791 RepID=UPI002547147F|nr:uncharacterized protein N7481_009299 [Penicillium waksmanii]KAJ5975592.1 hypothetical protein N7481_009299 [Penicillium waksmanii]
MEKSEQINSTAEAQEVPLVQLALMNLPTELHIQVAGHLSYPDALALKHSCRHFYSIVYTGVHLKVDWLVERFERKLECPMEKCSFRTDEAFCNWRIRRIMERRRLHLECRRSAGGCSVVHGQTCETDMMAAWLKLQRRGKLMQNMVGWGREGQYYVLFFDGFQVGADRTALLIAIFAMVLEVVWRVLMHICSG